MQQQFDYIIVGAGCSGLSLLMRMLHSPVLCSKKILIIDSAIKSANDRTWCFWDKGNVEDFWKDANIVCHQWKNLTVQAFGKPTLHLQTGDYRYKMIRSADFYRHAFAVIKQSSNVTLLYATVSAIDAENGTVTADDIDYTAPQIFSSVLLEEPVLRHHDIYLLQHFKGWVIETDADVFDDSSADLMNFKTSQENGCTFLYVLPLSARKALVEYTVFSEELLEDAAYDEGLERFIREELGLEKYSIAETEKGVIPMTNLVFPASKNKVFFIGTAGGQTKASTGYTFAFIQKQSEAIVKALASRMPIESLKQPARFHFYDTVLLTVLQQQKMPGAELFYNLFRKNTASRIFRFLDNETSLVEELQIMSSTKKSVFIPAAIASLPALRKKS